MNKIIFLLAIFFLISDCNAANYDLTPKHHKTLKKSKKRAKHPKVKALKNVKLSERVITTDLDIRNDIAYAPNENEPFTGKIEKYYANGKKETEEHYIGGKKNGLSTIWHENGKKYTETKYKDGKKSGPLIEWDENEHKVGEIGYKDGNRMDN